MLAVMRFVLLLLAMAVTALADTNIFTSPSWVVDGAVDSGPSPSEINVTVQKVPAGAFSELKVFFNYDGTNLAQVFSLKGQGTIQPLLLSPLVPGGAMRLTSYRDCDVGQVEPMGITDLQFKPPKGPKSPMQVKGRLTNFDSLISTDLKMKFYVPSTNSVMVDVRYKLSATRDICVDHTLAEEEDELRIAEMDTNFISPETNQNTRVRYIRVKDTTCDPYTGCHVSKGSFCADLDNIVGYLFGTPRLLGNNTLALLHTNDLPQNTPTLAIDFHAPPHHHVKPQAYVVPTNDPSDPNVTVWGNWVDVHKSYRDGQKVVRVRVVLNARDPNKPNCDQTKEPTP